MTKQEALVCSLYTGFAFCNFADIQKFAEEILERPVWTHEFASKLVTEQLKEKVKPQFMEMIDNLTV